jgi:fructokinase
MFAGIEGGGTKFVVAFGTGPDDLSDAVVFPTGRPAETLDRCAAEIEEAGPVDAVGAAMFGPLDLRRGSDSYGSVMATPKEGWEGTDVLGALRRSVGVPVGIDTDVNGAALAEQRWGAARGLDSLVYVTVGTGFGGGGIVGGRPMRGLNHPEMGHLRLPRHPEDDFAGNCPFHGDCLEGMVAGPAVEARFGRPGEDLGDMTTDAAALLGWYLGTALADFALVLSPERIVVGGGVMKIPGLLDRTRERFTETLAGYLPLPEVRDPATFLVRPGLGDRAGVLGAIALAADAAGAAA